MIRMILILILLFPISTHAIEANISPCFTPGQRCDELIIRSIDSANRTIDVQAYQLTSTPISSALERANRRGVKVQIILDKTQDRKKGYSPARYFHDLGIPTWIDRKVTIAHNKVIIIDDKIVITGSYNFSANAQKRNAENLLVIKSDVVAKAYEDNYNKRLKVSTPLSEYSAAR